jgi:hypothetical protein
MESRQRRRPEDASVSLVNDDDAAANLERLRGAARLLAATDEAIRRALSNDSERFLRAARQQGGQ